VPALVLQVGTYLAQAGVFRLAPHASGARLPRALPYQLSLATDVPKRRVYRTLELAPQGKDDTSASLTPPLLTRGH